jgi:FkbM family methyltransferase
MYAMLKNVLRRTPFYEPLAFHLRVPRAANEILKWTPQDDSFAEFYGRFLKPGDLVFDIGANVGGRVKVFLHIGCRVIAVEPQAFCSAVLKRAFGNSITTMHCAVSDSVGSANFYVGETQVLSSMSEEWMRRTVESGRFAGHRWQRASTVRTTTLDALCEKFGQPALVKIDVEGHEPAVLRGLSAPIRLVSVEFTVEMLRSAYACLDRFEQIGSYRYNYSPFESLEFQLAEWVGLTEIRAHLAHVDAGGWGDVYAQLQ